MKVECEPEDRQELLRMQASRAVMRTRQCSQRYRGKFSGIAKFDLQQPGMAGLWPAR